MSTDRRVSGTRREIDEEDIWRSIDPYNCFATGFQDADPSRDPDTTESSPPTLTGNSSLGLAANSPLPWEDQELPRVGPFLRSPHYTPLMERLNRAGRPQPNAPSTFPSNGWSSGISLTREEAILVFRYYYGREPEFETTSTASTPGENYRVGALPPSSPPSSPGSAIDEEPYQVNNTPGFTLGGGKLSARDIHTGSTRKSDR